jgi:hypothetical protein
LRHCQHFTDPRCLIFFLIKNEALNCSNARTMAEWIGNWI